MSLLGLILSAIAISVVFRFTFALAESALFSLSRWKSRHLTRNWPSGSDALKAALAQPQDLLATVILGETIANACIVMGGLWLIEERIWTPGVVVPVIVILVLFLSEVAPKALAVRLSESWALRCVQPVCLLQKPMQPLHRLAQRLNDAILRRLIPRSIRPQTATTDEDYEELLELGLQEGTLARSEKEIILEIIELDDKTAGDVMTPRSQLACVAADMPVTQMAEAARRYQHRRLPIFDRSPDTIVGILDTRKLLLNPDSDLEQVLDFPSFVPESMNLLELFNRLQRQRRGMAIVVDEFGGLAGVVTIEDILEELIGPIRNEGETAEFTVEKLGPDAWRVSGTLPIEDFAGEHPSLEGIEEVHTMGGLLMTQLGVVPHAGDSVEVRGLRLTALVVDQRRVHELIVERTKKGGR